MIAHRIAEQADTPDPLFVFLKDWQAAIAACEALPITSDEEDDAYREAHVVPLESRVVEGTMPAATSAAGAAQALREALRFDEMEDMETSLVKAALAFLEADALHSEPDDPLLALIAEYRRQAAIWTADTTPRSDAEEDAFYAATARPSFEKLRDDCPPATTLAGALAAFCLVADEDARLANWNAASSVLAAGNAYFSKEASR